MPTPGNVEPAFSLGIEEEYLLVDLATRDLVSDPPGELLQRCIAETDGRVSPEFLRSQLEVKTSVCASVSSMRRELAALRRKVCEVAADYGIAPIAASTHPFARPLHRPPHTDQERYATIAREVQGGARRMVICGMHVHVGLDDDELRIDVMNQLAYFVPHLLALSCSSPFWEGDDMGMQSFRLMLLSSLPRTGLPERFESYGEFRRHLDALLWKAERIPLVFLGAKVTYELPLCSAVISFTQVALQHLAIYVVAVGRIRCAQILLDGNERRGFHVS